MKKNLLLACVLLASLSLYSCNNNDINESVNISSSTPYDDLKEDNTLLKKHEIEIYTNEIYSVNYLVSKIYYPIDMVISNNDVATYDVNNNIIGKNKGETMVKVIFSTDTELVYSTLKVIVKEVKSVQSDFKTSEGDLKNKTFTVLGDSISDINVTAYPDNRPTFWCEMLRDRLNMKLYDFAISGSCAGFLKQQSNTIGKDYANYIQGSNVVNKEEVKNAVSKSDYVFLYFGNNDVTYNTNIGDYNDINDDNYKDV